MKRQYRKITPADAFGVSILAQAEPSERDAIYRQLIQNRLTPLGRTLAKDVLRKRQPALFGSAPRYYTDTEDVRIATTPTPSTGHYRVFEYKPAIAAGVVNQTVSADRPQTTRTHRRSLSRVAA